MRGTALSVLLVLASASGAMAEGLVSTVSNANVAITSSFDGETLSLFGNIEPDEQQARAKGPYEIIIAITGPSVARVARLKTDNFGLWMNTEQVEFSPFPTYYHVLASNPLDHITEHQVLEDQHILPDAQTHLANQPASPTTERFGAELVRLMTQKGLFGVNERGVTFLSPTAYVAQLTLPADISNGLFITQTYLFKNGQLLATRGDSFTVNKTGFERFLFTSAHEHPLLYGLACVALAIGTGWLGGLVFRR